MTNIVLLAVTLHTNFYSGMMQPNGSNFVHLERGEVIKVFSIGYAEGTNRVVLQRIQLAAGIVWRTNGISVSGIEKENP